jgi:hypothetical protein
MAQPYMSKKMALLLSFLLFSFGVVLLAYLKMWWPAFLLVIGLSYALRQYLIGKRMDMMVALVLVCSGYISAQFNLKEDLILPGSILALALYLLLKELFHKNVESFPSPMAEEVPPPSDMEEKF